MLGRAAAIIASVDSEADVDEDDAVALAESVQALDGWIRGGGFLPDAWSDDDDDDSSGDLDADDEDED